MSHAFVEFGLRYPALSKFEAKRLVQNVTEGTFESAHDHTKERVPNMTVVPIELHLPDVCDIFLLAVFGTHGVMDVMSNFVK